MLLIGYTQLSKIVLQGYTPHLTQRLAIVTGLRRGALLGLRWGDVVLEDEAPHVKVERTKNGDSHVSPITPDLVKEFKRMRRLKSTDSDLIFVGKHLTNPMISGTASLRLANWPASRG